MPDLESGFVSVNCRDAPLWPLFERELAFVFFTEEVVTKQANERSGYETRGHDRAPSPWEDNREMPPCYPAAQEREDMLSRS
jgi:hypothetical protein